MNRQLTGAEVLQALARSVMGSRENEDGGFLHVSGIRFKVHGKAIGEVEAGKDKKPLEPDHIYRVAIPDFLASGGDRYNIFIDQRDEYTGLPLRELIIDPIRSSKVIESRVEGRILRVKQ